MSLKTKLLDYLVSNKRLYRKDLTELVKKWHYEKSNAERRMRELCEQFPVKRFDQDGKEVIQSKWICYWELKGKIPKSVIFN